MQDRANPAGASGLVAEHPWRPLQLVIQPQAIQYACRMFGHARLAGLGLLGAGEMQQVGLLAPWAQRVKGF